MLRSLESFWDGFGAMRSTRQQRCKGRFRRFSAHWKNASIMGPILDYLRHSQKHLCVPVSERGYVFHYFM